MANSGRPRAVIVYRWLPQYRREFYELLRGDLQQRGISLELVYGDPDPADASKGDNVHLPWATQVNSRRWSIIGRDLTWQPVWHTVRGADLVIVEQASRLLINYPLQAAYLAGFGPKLALWGHGKDFRKHRASRIGEELKRITSRYVHWWFAYNERSASVVRGLGFPGDRITNVQNAIDTRTLVVDRASISPEEIARLRLELGLVGHNVCIYAGGMYLEKRLSFLLDASIAIRRMVPDFEIIFIGAGDDAHLVDAASREHAWIKKVGPRFGRDKVQYFALSKLLLMPGLVGLAVLDAFALECPIVTTDVEYHSPEIEYLVDGENGVIVPNADNVEHYAQTVANLLRDSEKLEHLRAGCRSAQGTYTVENMARRFADGVEAALR